MLQQIRCKEYTIDALIGVEKFHVLAIHKEVLRTRSNIICSVNLVGRHATLLVLFAMMTIFTCKIIEKDL